MKKKRMMSLDEIEKELESMELPKQLQLDDSTLITDTSTFVKTHIDFLRANSGKRAFIPYYNRLVDFLNKVKQLNN